MNQDADNSNEATPNAPPVHSATLSEPQAQSGTPPKKPKKERPEPTTPLGKLWHNWVKPIGTVVVIVVVLRSMLIDWNDVPTGSMEPEIAVGDRIAVNRLAYALQFPLTGPTIGIPFTPIQFDNPLDGIPQIQWGEPDRGDIVTFWNPVTDVRMVKRIAAVPGDRVAMIGGVLTINGETASYEDLDAATENLPLVTKYYEQHRFGNKKTKRDDLAYRSETILGLTRTIQHINERWLDKYTIIEAPDGSWEPVTNDTLVFKEPDPEKPGLFIDVKVPLDELLKQRPALKVVVRFIDGTPYVDGEAVSYNALAKHLLQGFDSGTIGDLLDRLGLGVKGHELLIDGEPVPYEFFRTRLDKQIGLLSKADQAQLMPLFSAISLLHQTMMTTFGPVTLGDDAYYMIGDNRNNSHDSRYFGPVDLGEITGEAFGVAFSFKDNEMFALPPRPAWSRWFKDLD